MLSDFINHTLDERYSIANIVYSASLYKTGNAFQEDTLTSDLETKLNIQFVDSISYLSTYGFEKCIEQLSMLSKNEKEKLLLVVVEESRKIGNASDKADMVLRLFNKIGLTEQEQISMITNHDMLKKNPDDTYKYAKTIVQGIMQKEVETKLLNLINSDPLKDSPLEGMKRFVHLANTISHYKNVCIDNKTKLDVNDAEIEEIFKNISDELTNKYLDLRPGFKR